jgi:two-component system response regulator FixJ
MPSKSPPSCTVYVVDDDAAFLGSLERILRAAGLTAVSYQTAAAFLHAAPDLIDGCVLLDVLMPEMDGLELQERLNSLGFNLPVIVMTARGDVETAVQAMKAGADDFIEKPFDDNLLLDAINAALTRVRGSPLREQMEAAGRVAKLSLRERQVLDGLAAGHPTKQIARDLGISARTIEAQRAHAGATGNTLSGRSGSPGGDGAVGCCRSRGVRHSSPAGRRRFPRAAEIGNGARLLRRAKDTREPG